jgi:uncharacterized protein
MDGMSKEHVRFPLDLDANVGTVAQERDYAQYVSQLVRQVLLTNPGERINRPDFGCGIKQMVFMPLNDATSGMTRVMIFQALKKWLDEVIEVNEVNVSVESTALSIGIVYTVRYLDERQFLNMEVTV